MPSIQRLAHPSRTNARRGGVLLIALIVTMVVAALAAAAFTIGMTQNREVESAAGHTRALYMAEAGITESMMQLGGAFRTGTPAPATIGNEAAPMTVKGGDYWCTLTDNGNTTWTVVSSGRFNSSRRTLEALLAPSGSDIYDYAIFAGNSSGSAAYTLELGGSGAQADQVDGNVFSAGGVSVSGDAAVTGGVEASGVIAGHGGTEGVKRNPPNITAMNYAANHDFDVADMFTTATLQSDDAGGSAYQLPETSPAHIFRKNPSDRTDETSATAKDDYFLEDPYESNSGFTAPNGTTGMSISLSGTGSEPGPSGTDKVYYIDGNLWVHNKKFLSFEIGNPGPDGAKLTFVVRGNVYFSDDIYLDDPDKSGIAFIAINDENEPDSGNIYLGDPRFGTVSKLESFLFAENTFYDNNLSADGSKKVHITGNMTAGDHVSIDRDYDTGSGIEHSKLTVEFDDRISTGALSLPGLPTTDDGVAGYRVLSWRELGMQ